MSVRVDFTEAEANLVLGMVEHFEKNQRFLQDYGKMGLAERIIKKIEKAEKEAMEDGTY